MLQTAMRNLHTEGMGSPRKLTTRLKDTYSQEFCYILWEMVEPHETLRMDFIELNKRLQGVRDKAISLPHRFRSLLYQNSSLTPSILSIYQPTSQEIAPSLSCVECKLKSENALKLPCSHVVCGLDCLAKIVAKDGFPKAKCSTCNTGIGTELLHSCFSKAAHTHCAHCLQPAFKYRKLIQCHHLLCRAHLVFMSHDCPICHVPYDWAALYELHRKCLLF